MSKVCSDIAGTCILYLEVLKRRRTFSWHWEAWLVTETDQKSTVFSPFSAQEIKFLAVLKTA